MRLLKFLTSYNNFKDSISDLFTYSRSLIYDDDTGFNPALIKYWFSHLGHLAFKKCIFGAICLYNQYTGISYLNALFTCIFISLPKTQFLNRNLRTPR